MGTDFKICPRFILMVTGRCGIMPAYILSCDHALVKILFYKYLRAFRGCSGDHLDACRSKKLLGFMAHAACNDNVDAVVVEPFGKDSRFVGRRFKNFGACNLIVFNGDKAELPAVTKVGC